jgi:hypothetical protein
MPISTTCSCGKSYRLKDEVAGKRVRCAQCGSVFEVPASDADVETGFEAVESPTEPAVSSFRSSAPVAPPQPIPVAEFDSPPPKRRKRRRRVSSDRGGGLSISISPGIGLGLLMMVGAVVWFVLALYIGLLFYYPPVMFVLGAGRFFWSLSGGEED